MRIHIDDFEVVEDDDDSEPAVQPHADNVDADFLNLLENKLFDGWYVRATAILGWMYFWQLEDNRSGMDRVDIEVIRTSSAGFVGWSRYCQTCDQEDCGVDGDTDVIYEKAVQEGIVDREATGFVQVRN